MEVHKTTREKRIKWVKNHRIFLKSLLESCFKLSNFLLFERLVDSYLRDIYVLGDRIFFLSCVLLRKVSAV